MIIDNKSYVYAMVNMQEQLASEYEMFIDSKGTPDEVSDAMKDIIEATRTIGDFKGEVT